MKKVQGYTSPGLFYFVRDGTGSIEMQNLKTSLLDCWNDEMYSCKSFFKKGYRIRLIEFSHMIQWIFRDNEFLLSLISLFTENEYSPFSKMASSSNRRYFQDLTFVVPREVGGSSKPLSSIGIGKFRRLLTVAPEQIFTNLILPRTDSADSWQDRKQFPYVRKFAPWNFLEILSQLSPGFSCFPVFHFLKLKKCQRKIQTSRYRSYFIPWMLFQQW